MHIGPNNALHGNNKCTIYTSILLLKCSSSLLKKLDFFFLSFYLNLVDGFVVLRGALGGGALI